MLDLQAGDARELPDVSRDQGEGSWASAVDGPHFCSKQSVSIDQRFGAAGAPRVPLSLNKESAVMRLAAR